MLVHTLSTTLAQHARSAGALLAGRRIGATRGAAFKLAVVLALACFALLIAAPFVQGLKVDPRRGTSGLQAVHGYNIFVGSPSMSPQEISRLPGVKHVFQATTATDADGATLPVLYSTCAELQAVVPVHNCLSRPQLISVHENQPVSTAAYRAPLMLGQSRETLRRLPESIVVAPLGDEFFSGILLPPTSSSANIKEDVLVNLSDGLASRDSFEAALMNRSVSAFVTNTYQDQVDQAETAVGYSRLVQAGLMIGSLALLVALAAAAVRNVVERKRETEMLLVLGVNRKSTAILHILVQSVPILIAGSVAALSGAALWLALARIDETMSMSTVWWAVLAGVPLANAAVVSMLTAPAATLRERNAGVRHDVRLWS
jgi:hypothetical protein